MVAQYLLIWLSGRSFITIPVSQIANIQLSWAPLFLMYPLPIAMVVMKILHERNLFVQLRLNANALCGFFIELEEHYAPHFPDVPSDTPYHNNVHAADVTHAVHCLINTPILLDCFTPLEVYTSSRIEALRDVRNIYRHGYFYHVG